MLLWYVISSLIIHFRCVASTCAEPTKFYADCSVTRSFSDAVQFCNSHQMTLVNLSNSSGTLISDVTALNYTFNSQNCSGNFWFSSENRTGLAVNTAYIDTLLDSLLTGVLNLVLCLIPFLCPATTTAAPITMAYTVCTRPNQQLAMRKCPRPITRVGLQTFRYVQQTIAVGLLDSFSSRSASACSALCSSNNACTGISYRNGTCNLYM